MRSAFAALSLVLVVAIGSRAEPVKKVKDNLEGTWEVVEFVMNGEPAPEEARKDMRFVFKEDRMTMKGGGDDKREFTIKLDPTKKPKAMDFTPIGGPFDGQTGPGIYDLDGDALKLCLPNKTTKDRPTEFKSAKGSDLGYIVLKRLKPGK